MNKAPGPAGDSDKIARSSRCPLLRWLPVAKVVGNDSFGLANLLFPKMKTAVTYRTQGLYAMHTNLGGSEQNNVGVFLTPCIGMAKIFFSENE